MHELLPWIIGWSVFGLYAWHQTQAGKRDHRLRSVAWLTFAIAATPLVWYIPYGTLALGWIMLLVVAVYYVLSRLKKPYARTIALTVGATLLLLFVYSSFAQGELPYTW